MQKCNNCGCYNEPESDGWAINFTIDGCYPVIKCKCPVCGQPMEEDDE